MRGLNTLISYQNHIIAGQISPNKDTPVKIDPYSFILNFNRFVYNSRCLMSLSLQYLAKVNVQNFLLACYSINHFYYVEQYLLEPELCSRNCSSYIQLMNPFERLRKKIETINVEYTFEEANPNTVASTNGEFGQRAANQVRVSNQQDMQNLKEVYSNQQISHIIQINQQASKLEQLEKALKRSESVIQNQVSQIVSLQKQNQMLKTNLNQQYNAVVQYDEKQRKYKQQIYRINITVNQLAIEINAERNSKKILIKEIETLKDTINKKTKQIIALKETSATEKLKLQSQLQQRKEMFEYNIKKNAEERKEFKLSQAKNQELYQSQSNSLKITIQNLKQELSQSRKGLQIEGIHKKNNQEALKRQTQQHMETKESCKKLTQDLQLLKQKFDFANKNKDELEKNMSSLGSELAEEKKNVKVKVIEVRDETLVLELEMYKRQCKQLMQERAIMKNLNSPYEGTFQSSYRVIKQQTSDNI